MLDLFFLESLSYLREFLEKYLPLISNNWWEDCVYKNLSYVQKKDIEKKGIKNLKGLDFLALLKIIDKNWIEISKTTNFDRSERALLNELIAIRNKDSHKIETNDKAPEDYFRELDTLQRFLVAIESKIDLNPGCSELINKTKILKDKYIEEISAKKVGTQINFSGENFPLSPEEWVPPYIRKELANYVIPFLDNQSLPEKINHLINQGKNVFILGESGLGKSLLMAYCYLNLDLRVLTCFYAIDRTQGPNVYQSASVINSLRTQIEEIAGLSKTEKLAPSGPKKDWVYEREYLERVLRCRAEEQPDRKLVMFLDGIDENFLETNETEFVLYILKSLIIDDSLGVVWVLSSQPYPKMTWIKDCFNLLFIEGLGGNEARALLLKYLSMGFDISYPAFYNELITRSRLDNELYDPEMIVMLGKCVTEKLGKDSGKIRFISEDILKSFLGMLPLNPREKYRWLFDRYTNESKLRDIPSLEENAASWNSFCQSIPYTKLLQDILSILCIIRSPIPFEILAWALDIEDKKPNKDFRGRDQYAFIRYPENIIEKERDFLRTALLDLQSFVKVIDQKEGSYAFCKEAIRESFSGFLSEKNKLSAKSRLAALASEEVQFIQSNTVNDRPPYITRELLYFFSLNPEAHCNSIEQFILFEFFPEWLEKRALCDGESESQWTSDFMADLKLLDNLTLTEKAKANSNLVINIIKDWKYVLDNFPKIIASFLRNENRLSQIWNPAPLNQNLLVPINGYSRKINGHSGKITSLAMLPDGRLVSLGRDDTIRIWDITTGESSIVGESPSFLSKIKALPDGHLVCYFPYSGC